MTLFFSPACNTFKIYPNSLYYHSIQGHFWFPRWDNKNLRQ